MSNYNVIETNRLTKTYGKNRGIIDVNLNVTQGEVFGYLGPNGAGKTTTIRLLLDFLRPTQGTASIFGLNCRQHSVNIHSRLGYLSGEPSLYNDLTGEELLRYVSQLRGSVDWSYTVGLARRLETDLTRKLRTLSHGNRQKIGLVQVFMHKPELIILDEPTGGLDPLMQQEFYQLIEETRKDGRTVFLSSHILPEVERVCDRVGIIREGKLIAVETIDALKSHAARRLEVHFARPVSVDSFSKLPDVTDLKLEASVLNCRVTGSLDRLVKTLAQFEVINIINHEPSLEDVFLTYYTEGPHYV